VLGGGVPAWGQQPVQHRAFAVGPWHFAMTWSDTLADTSTIPESIRARLLLGDQEGAAALLARYGSSLDGPLRLELAGEIAAARGQWLPAAHAFAAAATMRTARLRGMLLARAGAAFEEAGQADTAMAAYRSARVLLPEIAGWLALREALLIEDPAVAESLFALTPAPAWPLALQARARLRLVGGDPEAAESLLDAAGLSGEAAELALARGDTGAATRHAVAAMEVRDTADVERALALFRESIAPPTAAVALAAARGAERLRVPREAATWGLRAVALGDSTPRTLLTVGAWLEAAGRRREALPLYTAAGNAGTFALARARLRLGDRGAITTLRRFARSRPDEPLAPVALFVAADALSSDSLFHEVATRWPRSPAASDARERLALRRLRAGDSAGAEPYLDDEVAYGGAAALRARYLRARVWQATGDRERGLADLAALGTEDSLGYYGLIARRAADLPDPVLRRPDPVPPAGAVTDLLTQLGLLDTLGFRREADLLVASLVQRDWTDPSAQLDAADGLVRLGHANQAIRLGYAAARTLSFRDPRVLRAVFPWPNRAAIIAEAEAFDLDPFLVAGLIRQESWFLPTARSRAGAVGYLQLVPATAREVARRAGVDWTDGMLVLADANLHVGCAHLAGLLRAYDADTVAALAAYNAGGTPVRRWRRGARDPVSFVEGITYPETQEYVRAVVRNAALYRWLYDETEHGS
jgi:soluble lytic murein transglycosylase